MYPRKTLLTSIMAMLVAFPALVWAAALQVEDVNIGTGVHARVATGISRHFDASVGKLYAFTRIVGAQGDTHVYHKWYHGDQLMADVPLTVRSTDWRTWSTKNVQPEWTGDWRLVVVDEDGTVLKTVKFEVD